MIAATCLLDVISHNNVLFAVKNSDIFEAISSYRNCSIVITQKQFLNILSHQLVKCYSIFKY